MIRNLQKTGTCTCNCLKCCLLQLSVPGLVTKRHFHSLSTVQLSPRIVWLLIFGGWRSAYDTDPLSHFAIVELCEYQQYMHVCYVCYSDTLRQWCGYTTGNIFPQI